MAWRVPLPVYSQPYLKSATHILFWRMLSIKTNSENILKATCVMEPISLAYLIRIIICHIQINNHKGWDFFIFALGMNNKISGLEMKNWFLKINLVCCEMSYVLHLYPFFLSKSINQLSFLGALHLQFHYVSTVRASPWYLLFCVAIASMIYFNFQFSVYYFRSNVWKHEQKSLMIFHLAYFALL